MAAREEPTYVMHFTHVDHLPTVVENGLMSDTDAQRLGLITTEVGNPEIKDRRRRRAVPIVPGGVVADYAPFYFRAPSPMMSAIAHRNGVDYDGGTARLVYLVTTLERLFGDGLDPLVTDRNASLEIARFRHFTPDDPLDDDFIAWDVMKAQYWNNFPEGRELRMAECLIQGRVPWESFTELIVSSSVVATDVQAILAAKGSTLPIHVRPNWYL